MRRWQRSVTTVLVAALLIPAPEAAAATSSDWAHVRTLKPGLKLAIHLRGGGVRKGAFVQADPDGVTLRAKEGPYCEDAGLIGAAYGFLIGAVVGGLSGLALAAQGEGAAVYRTPVSASGSPS